MTTHSTPNAQIRSFFLEGPAGRLEALLNAGKPDAQFAAVVCHPHPLYGGTMHNKVVYNAMKALRGFGFPVLRFNFRGTELSEGEHDYGAGERQDVQTALEWLKHEFSLPLIFAGFSFGAAVGLRAACPDPDVKALISLGTPVAAEGRSYTYEFLNECAKPKLFVSGDRDQFGPAERLYEVTAAAAEPKRFVLIHGADHFFAGQLESMKSAIEFWVRDTLLQPQRQ
ncbi:alpha/beta hydrolase [Candidatus Korobacter versatilis]|nr:alpha/beta family hydrolase [Candidatus Koribacter versatilis]